MATMMNTAQMLVMLGGQIYRGGEQSASGKNMLVMGGGGQEGVAGRTERQPPTTWPSSYPLILEDSVPD